MSKRPLPRMTTSTTRTRSPQEPIALLDVAARLPAVSEDEQFVMQAGVAVREFLKSVTAFFLTASSLERAAVQTLQRAQALQAPMTMEADTEIQRFVKATTTQRQGVEAHWGVTLVINGFHKRLVAARKRAVEPLEQASDIGNRLHNQYVDAERRRAAVEQDRLRRAAEERAARERQEELDRMEHEAVAAEEASADLSARERLFVKCLMVLAPHQNPSLAAQQAGYKDPSSAAVRLLTAEKIQAAIEGTRDARAIRTQAAARQEAPLEVQVETVRPNISRGGSGGFDRSTWGVEVLDEQALIDACINGKHGIPRDILMVNRTKLGEYARSLYERIDLWPGCRHVKTTRVV